MFTFGKLARSRCSECGGSSITWMTAQELVFHVPLPDRRRFTELLRWVGPNADAWKCGECIGAGVFGPTHMAL